MEGKWRMAEVREYADDELKKKSDQLFKDLGIDMLMKKLEQSRKSALQGHYRTSEDVIAHMRRKFEI